MNTIHPSVQRVHSSMSNLKDAVTSAAAAASEKISTRPANFTVRHDPKHRRDSRPHTLSTYSEDPSEILGSGRQVSSNHPHNNDAGHRTKVSPAKRKQDTMMNNQKASKPKRLKEHDDKGPGPSSLKKTSSGPKRNGVSSGPSSNPAQQKRCGYCGCTTTPMWRRGPDGPSTLCNACGVKWKHGKILQDPNTNNNDGNHQQQTLKSGAASSTSTSSTSPPGSLASVTPPINSKPSKERSGNGHARHGDEKKWHSSKVSAKKASHGTLRGDFEARSGEKSSSAESKDGSRALETERIVPVKKRHSGKVVPVSPPGPRMVPIHELGDPTRTPFKFTPAKTSPSRKHGFNDGEAQLNGRTKHMKSEYIFQDHSGGTSSSSGSTTSAQSDIQDAQGAHDEEDAQDEEDAPLDVEGGIEPQAGGDHVSLYAAKNLYTNNTATFPLHFPTISIAFGPNNAYYTYPNCAVVLFENHFRIKLVQGGEKTEIDVWKEGIEGTEFQAVDVGDGESMIVMKALLRQYLTRFDKELLNPDRNESLIVFRFRERLDGGGPSVKPLLEHWLATDIPVPPPPSNDSLEA
ncbi:hypothetical protein BC939DRAFT_462100 [Gamsiella multidivaricata]|uniref:uncharacterized protein n=1 Tax=Gamsiella multidivaricata TaxID=101098 RepID=UPI00221FCD7E|nr:uncharacterized protein BC939DRAFT_462100 [Gamsiella multidivaricata]KAI7818825.1 hypothetical protein BC939DRAFT_462100 [Gamsiella multidivaricata]